MFVYGCVSFKRSTIKSDVQNIFDQEALVHRILDSFDKYESQIIYTQINRDSKNNPSFKSFYWNSKPNYYFYPASMVKMPVAFLAAEKINRLRKNVNQIHLFTPLKIDTGHSPQTKVTYDSTSVNYLPSIGHYIKKIFIVSDNDAYNRLYEFIGQKEINDRMHTLGYQHTHIIHRLDAPEFDYETNKFTNPCTLYEEDLPLYQSAEKYNMVDVRIKNTTDLKKGKGYMKGEQQINTPFDFSTKNFFSLQDMHDVLKNFIFPESVTSEKRFDIADHDRKFILTQMSKLPRESKHPNYDSTHLDGYCKFFMLGDSKEKLPEHIRIFNKVGWAYGYLTDVAYIVDLKNNLEFILAATINTNTDGIYNDGIYEYEAIGLPYLSKVGRLVYEYESKRNKPFRPNLSSFKLDYTE